MSERRLFWWPIIQAIFTQEFVVLFCSGYKDGEITFLASMVASAVYWLCTIAIIVRRVHTPTLLEVLFVRWGLVLVVLIGTPVFQTLAKAALNG